ncbi:MAG: cytochrome c maturation protein CcmE [Salinisphaera sp.]|nr:cytochrome c maturation protein CcmE [Salinisphaera sp.]
MKPRYRRLLLILAGVACVVVAAVLVLNAFRSNLVFFYTPTQVAENEAPVGEFFRIGGMVENGSVSRSAEGVTVRFVVTDTARSIPVQYRGVLPDLFSEGEGVVAQGKLGSDGVFYADQVLAKHDADYMPPEAAQALAEADAEQTQPAARDEP